MQMRKVLSLDEENTSQILPKAVARGSAYAKTILIGEHAVVYGYPAIAAPIKELSITATASLLRPSADSNPQLAAQIPKGLTLDVLSSADGLRHGKRRIPTVGSPSTGAIYIHETSDRFEDELAQSALRGVLDFLERTPGEVEVSVSGSIPTARGLGSSAAMSSAITQAVAQLYEYPLTQTERYDLVQAVEKIAHGTPSGLDAFATMSKDLIWFKQGRAESIATKKCLPLVVADTGIAGRTVQAVNGLRNLKTKNPNFVDPLLAQIGELVQDTRQALECSDLTKIGENLNHCQDILARLKLSHPALDNLITAARAAGALGAKLTGSGLGGCMIALAQSKEHVHQIQANLIKAGAKHVWQLDLNELK